MASKQHVNKKGLRSRSKAKRLVAKIGPLVILPSGNATDLLMALHRDIFWIGRQWAVTGAGIQAVDQRLRGVLDIAVARIWDDELVQARRSKAGVNAADFDKALMVARERFPNGPVEPPASDPILAQMKALGVIESAIIETPVVSPVVPAMTLRTEGRLARFLPQWRVRR